MATLTISAEFLPHSSLRVLGAGLAGDASYSLAAIFVLLVFGPTRPVAQMGLRISVAPFLLSLLITATLLVRPFPFVYELLIIVAVYALGAWMTRTVQRSKLDRMVQLMGKSFDFARPDAT